MFKRIAAKFDLFKIAFILVSLVGIIVRLWSFGSNPPGLNSDIPGFDSSNFNIKCFKHYSVAIRKD